MEAVAKAEESADEQMDPNAPSDDELDPNVDSDDPLDPNAESEDELNPNAESDQASDSNHDNEAEDEEEKLQKGISQYICLLMFLVLIIKSGSVLMLD